MIAACKIKVFHFNSPCYNILMTTQELNQAKKYALKPQRNYSKVGIRRYLKSSRVYHPALSLRGKFLLQSTWSAALAKSWLVVGWTTN